VGKSFSDNLDFAGSTKAKGKTMPEDNQENVESEEKIDMPSIGDVLVDYVQGIGSLVETFPLTMTAISSAYKKTLGRFQQFEKEKIVFREDDEEKGQTAIFIRQDYFQEFRELDKQLRNHGLAFSIVPRSFVVSLVSQYDAFLGRLIRAIFLIKPELLNASDKNLTLAQLLEFGSIEEAREHILEKEVETVLRKSHTEQFQWMENKFDMQLRKGLDVWPVFVELTERRNLFVHASGVVSSQYLKVCCDHDVKFDQKSEISSQLEVDPEYFYRAYQALFEIGVKLAHVLWRKFQPDNLEDADKNLIEVGYEPLYEEKYGLAKVIFDFACSTLKKHSNAGRRRILVVNRALAYKWSGDEKKSKDIVTTEDWSDTSDTFKLAEAVLLDDFPKALKIMKDLGKSKSPDIHDYRAWPLFKEFRKTSEFQALFEEIFEEPLNKVSFDSIDEAEEAIAEQQGVEEEIALAIEPEEAEIADAVIQQS
jgi:hypothetical protein